MSTNSTEFFRFHQIDHTKIARNISFLKNNKFPYSEIIQHDNDRQIHAEYECVTATVSDAYV